MLFKELEDKGVCLYVLSFAMDMYGFERSVQVQNVTVTDNASCSGASSN